MRRIVVTDADMLFGATTRALFIYLDYNEVVHTHWSPRILNEMSVALVGQGRKASMAAARANEQRMNASLPNAEVDQALVDIHEAAMLPFVQDPNDAHVVACAYELRTGGHYPGLPVVVLSTRNLGDYDIPRLATIDVEVMHPDAFLTGLRIEDVAAAFRDMRLDIATAPGESTLLARLLQDGNPKIVVALQSGWQSGHFLL